MNKLAFIAVGENIHCTRIYKVGGNLVQSYGDAYVIKYDVDGEARYLPIPPQFVKSEDWEKKKVKHVAVAVWQGVYGDEAGKTAGIDYLENMVRIQETNGASFIDLNVDEFSTDVQERAHLIQWAAGIIQNVASVPLSIDSSDITILRSGLEACDRSKGKPMVNSISLERADAIQAAGDASAVVIAGATGETRMPSTVEDRLYNYDQLLPRLIQAGFQLNDIYLDPLIFPVAVDVKNGKLALDCIKTLREKYGPEIHFAPGISNVSYGLPKRNWVNLVFAYLAVQNGCDGGIVDPRHINAPLLESLDTDSEPFMLAKALLMGEDAFAENYILAVRKGVI